MLISIKDILYLYLQIITKLKFMATKEEIKRSKELVDEAIEVLLKKTGTKKEDVIRPALIRWSMHNLDLLTEEEYEYFKPIIDYNNAHKEEWS